MIILLVVLSVVVFVVIQLPPGDYATSYINQMRLQGMVLSREDIANFKHQYNLDLPIYKQYLVWVNGMLHGNLGQSFAWKRSINDLLRERLPLTILISVLDMIFTYVVAVPIGIYSATHQYSPLDYVFTVIGFVGVATPDFLLALLVLFALYEVFGIGAGGLFSAQFASAAWSWAKVRDLINHLWTPGIIIGLAGTAGRMRVMRATMLDELSKPYVETARAKGLPRTRLLLKYPVRVAINPILSTIGWTLPGIFSGSTIVAVVLGLPTVGPLLLDAMRSQDFFVAGSILMILSALTIFGTFISDLLLAWADPRIRFD